MQSDRQVLRDRLNKVQMAVHKAAEETWKHQHPSDIANNGVNIKDNNASFLLGMDLFGQDVATLEQTIRDKLEDVEEELNKLSNETSPNEFMTQDSQDSQTRTTAMMMSTIGETWDSINDDDDSDKKNNEEEEDLLLQNDPQALQDQIDFHRKKIAFLKQASLARTAIDGSKTISNPTLSPNDMDLVEASRLLVQANELLRQAESFAASMQTGTESATSDHGKNNDDTANGDHDDDTMNGAASQDHNRPQAEESFATKLISKLRNEARLQRTKLLITAGNILDMCVQLTPTSIVVKHAKQLDEAYQVLEEFDAEESNRIMREILRRFAKQLYVELLKPIIHEHHGKKWKIVEVEEKSKTGLVGVSTNKGPVHRIDWTLEQDGKPNGMEKLDETSSALAPWRDTFDVLTQILVFVQGRVLMNRQDPSEFVGAFLFGDPDAMPSELNLHAMGVDSTRIGADKGMLSQPILDLMYKACVPDHYDFTDEDSATLEDIGKELKSYAMPFCKAMCQKWFIPLSPKPKLIEFCDKLPQKYIDHRRCILLDKARDILIQNDYHNTQQVGITELPEGVEEYMEIFFLQSCSVSVTAIKIVELVRETMEEVVQAVDAPPSLQTLRPTLYKTAREMFSLYKAIIPAEYQKEVKTVPRTAAVMHNDAAFFSNVMMTLGLEYKGRFTNDKIIGEDEMGPIMEQTFMFIDLVPVFRELAMECLGDMLVFQKKQLNELIHPRLGYFARSLQSNESLHEWSEAETALAAATYHMKHLQQAWQNILSKDVFGPAMGELADVVFAAFLEALLVQDLIVSPAANQFLASLLGKAMKDIGEFFQGSKQPAKECCLEWNRFACIVKFLETHSLSDIKDNLAMGDYFYLTTKDIKILLQACHSHQAYDPEYGALMEALANYGSQSSVT